MFGRSWMSKSQGVGAGRGRTRAGKSVKSARKRYDARTREKLQESLDESLGNLLTSPIITLIVGPGQRVFAAHEDVLSRSPFFCGAIGDQFLADGTKRVNLPEEEPEILSCVLEFLYKGDYTPRLLHNPAQDTWSLENAVDQTTNGRGSSSPTIHHASVDDLLLRDTVVYCSAEKYGLPELKDLALRKQGFQSRIPVDVILRSARWAYEHTPDTDCRLRAHYLAMIIRCRRIFKKSGTMQLEMEMGHKFFFDLFVAMCNHVDDLGDRKKTKMV